MIDRDIWIAANEMIKLYGDEAAVHAALRADALRDLEDEEGYATWKMIVAAINKLTSTEATGSAH